MTVNRSVFRRLPVLVASIPTLFVFLALLNPPASGADTKALNKPPKGFVALFNGEDLTGWKGLVGNPVSRAKMTPEELAVAQKAADDRMRENWQIEDGALVFNGKAGPLCTAKDYGDFELLVDWKIGKGGDSGIYLRGSPQAQIWDPANTGVYSGALYNNQFHPSKPIANADNPIGEWNTFRIKMIGDRVTVHLNDVLVVDDTVMENYWDRGQSIYPTGQIELQDHGAKLWFRNIYLREIPRDPKANPTQWYFKPPPTPTPDPNRAQGAPEAGVRQAWDARMARARGEAPAPAAGRGVGRERAATAAPSSAPASIATPAAARKTRVELKKEAEAKWRTEWKAKGSPPIVYPPTQQWLFNGHDFTGWKQLGGQEMAWAIKDGALVCIGGPGGSLCTEREFSDFELEMEFRVFAGGNSGVFLRHPLEGNPAFAGMEIQILDDGADEFANIRPEQFCGSLYDVSAPSVRASREPGEWQTYLIRCEGRRLKIDLNGQTIQDVDLDSFPQKLEGHPGLKRASGHIGLQLHNGVVEFRKIRIRELTGEKTAP